MTKNQGTGETRAEPAPRLDRALLGGVLAISSMAAVVGLTRLLQDVAIAWTFGTTAAVDAFYFISNLIQWPVMVMLSTSTLLIAPAEAALRKRSPNEVLRFRGELLGWTMLACVGLLPAAYLSGMAIVASPLAGLPADTVAAAAQGVALAFPAVAFGVLSSVAMGWLIAGNHRTATVLDGIPPLTVIIALALLGSSIALYGGLALGAAVQAAAAIALLVARGALAAPRLSIRSGAWRDLARPGLAMLTVQVAFTALPVIDQFFAARLDSGTVSALNYANRLLIGVLGPAAIGLQRTALPLLADWMARDAAEARRFARRWTLRMFGAGLLLASVVWLAAPLVIDILYARGSFSAEDANAVVRLLQVGALQAPFFLAGTLMIAALMSARRSLDVAVAGVVGLLAKLILSSALAETWGATGLQLATVGLYAVTLAATWWALARPKAGMSYEQLKKP